MERNGIHIIDLNKTAIKIDEAAEALKAIACGVSIVWTYGCSINSTLKITISDVLYFFGTFCFLSASACLSLSHNARIAPLLKPRIY